MQNHTFLRCHVPVTASRRNTCSLYKVHVRALAAVLFTPVTNNGKNVLHGPSRVSCGEVWNGTTVPARCLVDLLPGKISSGPSNSSFARTLWPMLLILGAYAGWKNSAGIHRETFFVFPFVFPCWSLKERLFCEKRFPRCNRKFCFGEKLGIQVRNLPWKFQLGPMIGFCKRTVYKSADFQIIQAGDWSKRLTAWCHKTKCPLTKMYETVTPKLLWLLTEVLLTSRENYCEQCDEATPEEGLFVFCG